MSDVNPLRRRTKHTRSPAARDVILPPTPAVRSARAATIVRWFGLDEAIKQRATSGATSGATSTPVDAPPSPPAFNLDLAPATITLVTGASGAGKSTLLRDVRRAPNACDANTTWIDLASLALPDVPVVDCIDAGDSDDRDDDLRRALLDLARVGLAEAWTYLRTPAELSDGQRWRLRLAIALERARRATSTSESTSASSPGARAVLVADEFAALLDRVTAAVVARSLRRAIGPGSPVVALVATTHEDVVDALSPDVIVRCDFGRVRIERAPTILHGFAACGFADQRTSKAKIDSPPARRGQRSRKRRRPTPGGFMRKILIASLAPLLATALIARAADEPGPPGAPRSGGGGGNDRLLTEPPSPFESPRSPFDLDPRPPLAPRERLLPSVERELDRGNGRIESDAEFELRRQQRDQDERRGILPEQREFDRFNEERDRNLRLDERARREAIARANGQFVESESQRLAAERERFYRSAGIDPAGASHDTRVLKNLERSYQRDVKQLKKERSADLKRLAKEDLKPDARAAARSEIDERYRAAQRALRDRYAADRARIMGD